MAIDPNTKDDISSVQNDIDGVLIEGAKAVQAVAGELIQTALESAKRSKSSNVKVEIEKGTTHRDLWTKYGQGVESSIPARNTLTVARNALSDGQSKESTLKILTADPEYQRIEKQNPEKAQQYAQLAVSAANRKNLVVQQSEERQLQTQRQKNKGFELEQ